MAQPSKPPLRQSVAKLIPDRKQTIDARLYVAVNGLPHRRGTDDHIELLSDLGKGAGWVAGAVWLALRGGPTGRRAGAASIGAMFTAVALVQGPLKSRFKRHRPFRNRLAIVVGPEPVDSSFPSGHTAGSFAAAVALAAYYRKDRPILLGLAGAVGVSRVYLGHHFPSDVVVGAGVGTAIGLAWARLLGGRAGDALDPGATAGGGRADGHGARAVGGPRRAVPDRRRPLV